MQAAVRASMDEFRRQRRAEAQARVKVTAKMNRGMAKHPRGATKVVVSRSTRRSKAKVGRKTARRTR
jgi:hypothetical protein